MSSIIRSFRNLTEEFTLKEITLPENITLLRIHLPREYYSSGNLSLQRILRGITLAGESYSGGNHSRRKMILVGEGYFAGNHSRRRRILCGDSFSPEKDTLRGIILSGEGYFEGNHSRRRIMLCGNHYGRIILLQWGRMAPLRQNLFLKI